jgi:hypothetical protein
MTVATPLRSIVEATRQERASAEYVPLRSLDDSTTDKPLSVVALSMWGKRRLYVNTADEEQVGWVDLDTGERSLAMPGLASEFEAAIQNHGEEDYLPRRGIAASAEHPFTAAHSFRSLERPGDLLEAQLGAALQEGQE